MGRYTEVVTRNLLVTPERGRVLVRHLPMPGHLECCLRPAAEWVAREMPEIGFTLTHGYAPAYRAAADAARGVGERREEEAAAETMMAEPGLRRRE